MPHPATSPGCGLEPSAPLKIPSEGERHGMRAETVQLEVASDGAIIPRRPVDHAVVVKESQTHVLPELVGNPGVTLITKRPPLLVIIQSGCTKSDILGIEYRPVRARSRADDRHERGAIGIFQDHVAQDRNA